MIMKSIELKYIVEQFELYCSARDSTARAWFDKRDGEVHTAENDNDDYDEDELEESNEPSWYELHKSGILVDLPDHYDLRQYEMMEEFAEIQASIPNANKIIEAIRGKGAFRRFRATVERLGLLKDWYAFHDREMLDKARRWCENNGIDYTPKPEQYTYRRAAAADIETVTDLFALLYLKSKTKIKAHRAELRTEIEGQLTNANDTIFVAHKGEIAIGAAHVSLRREYVEGTDGGAVGYLEGIFVLPEYRLNGIARSLLGECRKWAVQNECEAFASDCEIDNELSYRFHMKTGFEEASRNVHFTFPLFNFGLWDDDENEG